MILPEDGAGGTGGGEYTAAKVHVGILDPGLDVLRPEHLLIHGAHLPAHPEPVEGQAAKTEHCRACQGSLT